MYISSPTLEFFFINEVRLSYWYGVKIFIDSDSVSVLYALVSIGEGLRVVKV